MHPRPVDAAAGPGSGSMPRYVPWSEATRQALYGHGGFFHRPAGPAGHFRTSVHASGLFAAAVVELARTVDAALGHPDQIRLVDVGAGRGELVLAVRALLAGEQQQPQRAPPLSPRLSLCAVEVAERPPTLPADIGWSAELPERVEGLLVANEWLDDLPVDVVQVGPDGPHRVLVDPATGHESPGGPIGVRDAGWLARWWPLDDALEGDRAEVGLERDQAWAGAVAAVRRGVAVAVDYGHLLDERRSGRYAGGTLVGYRAGRAVSPVPDGSCDVTAYVAVDACAQAGRAAGATATALLRQREVLRGFGLRGSLPPVEVARADPAGYAVALQRASQEAELTDPDGLGGFWWLAQSVGIELPRPLQPGARER
jgi:SAM-dependent MidA family methyltransferase